MRRLYVAEVESVDDRLGMMIEALRKRGAIDNTYFIFTADHGEQFGEHGFWGHGAQGRDGNYHEASTRIPLIISGPGVVKGGRSRAPVSLVDVMPTVDDLLRLQHPRRMQGRSVRPALVGKEMKGRTAYFTDVRRHDHVNALVSGDFKVILHASGYVELFNVREDPGELRNIGPQQSELAHAMMDRVKQHRAENARLLATRPAMEADSVRTLSDEERKRLDELRSLGY